MTSAEPVKILKDNYVWVIHSNPDKSTSRPAVIVDPGVAGPVTQYLNTHLLNPVAILITHHHYDHIDGTKEIQQSYSIPVYGPDDNRIKYITDPVKGGDIISPDNELGQFTIMSVPGHTSTHIAYYDNQDKLFCGDTLFAAGCGRLFDGTAEQLYSSLKKITELPDYTKIFCAHEYTESNLEFALHVEPDNKQTQKRYREVRKTRARGSPTIPSELGIEKKTNPFLRCAEPGIIDAVESFVGKKLATEEEVFRVLRYWKDTF